MSAAREFGENPFYVGEKPHVEHPVGFVKHHALYLVEKYYALRHEIDEPPGAGDEGFRAAPDVLDLVELANAAEYACKRQSGVFRIKFDVLRRLRGEFARWRQDERARAACRSGPAHLRETVENREHERGRLAGSRLGDAYEIAPVENRGDRFFLYRGRTGIPRLGHGFLYPGIESAENIVFKHGSGIIP